jgi:CheY-like chemotaxis protein
VEDNEGVRTLVVTVLETAGYTVLAAPTGQEALELCRQHPGRIHLLITDMILPRMTGQQVAAAVRRLHSGLKVLLMSGYPATEVQASEVPGAGFMSKPFVPQVLLQQVRDLLAEEVQEVTRS